MRGVEGGTGGGRRGKGMNRCRRCRMGRRTKNQRKKGGRIQRRWLKMCQARKETGNNGGRREERAADKMTSG